jgi:hypothetical protein
LIAYAFKTKKIKEEEGGRKRLDLGWGLGDRMVRPIFERLLEEEDIDLNAATAAIRYNQ